MQCKSNNVWTHNRAQNSNWGIVGAYFSNGGVDKLHNATTIDLTPYVDPVRVRVRACTCTCTYVDPVRVRVTPYVRNPVRAYVRGHTISTEDGQIAAIALTHRLPLATRNGKDFKGIEGLTLLNPWE